MQTSVVFIGTEEDVFAVKELYLATIKAAKKLYRQFSKEFRINHRFLLVEILRSST